MKLQLKAIRKYYGNVRANDGVDLTVQSGSIHAVLGENGAGKSTLMKILAGYIPKTGGDIFINDRRVAYQTPAQAAKLGIGMLYQDPLDFANLTVLENFMIGQVRGLALDANQYAKRLSDYCSHLNFVLEPQAQVGYLTVGERQQLEIIRLLALGTRVLILDEPTTGISDEQKEILFNALKTLAQEGNSVLLVSHKLEDTLALCDTVTVLRQGVTVGTRSVPLDASSLLEMMFKEVTSQPVKLPIDYGDTVLELKNIRGRGGRSGLNSTTISIRQREVVGLAGLEGSGQGVFLRIAAGLQRAAHGEVKINGVRKRTGRHQNFRKDGVAFLPASRLEEGLIRGLTIAEHVVLDSAGGFLIDTKTAASRALENISNFKIAGAPQSQVEALSGGNQQRLLLSFLPRHPKLLLLENPTRGLDVDSALWVWRHLLKTYNQTAALVFSSSELDEILMVADRILVFYQGRIIKDVDRNETDAHLVGTRHRRKGLSSGGIRQK